MGDRYKWQSGTNSQRLILLLTKAFLFICLAMIFYQDIKERAVWWFLFPAFLIMAGILHYSQSLPSLFLINIGVNFLIMSIIIAISYIYAQLKMKVQFLDEAFGIGDLLFFLGLTLAFPTISFVIIMVFSLLFSLGLHLLLSKNSIHKTVPLAGYASFFLIFIYSVHWAGYYNNLYFY